MKNYKQKCGWNYPTNFEFIQLKLYRALILDSHPQIS